MTIGGSAHDFLGPHGAPCSRFVVHENRLAQLGLQAVGQQPGVLVQRAASRKTHDHTDWLGGKGPSTARDRQAAAKSPKQ